MKKLVFLKERIWFVDCAKCLLLHLPTSSNLNLLIFKIFLTFLQLVWSWKVTEKPFIGPDPIINKIIAAINVVIFASKIVVFDFVYPESKATILFFSGLKYLFIYQLFFGGGWCWVAHWVVIPSTRLLCNFLNIDPFLTKIIPIESSHSQLSIGTGLVKNGSILRKLWSNRIELLMYM